MSRDRRHSLDSPWNRRAVVLAAVGSFAWITAGRAAEGEVRFERSDLTVETVEGKKHAFRVELALNVAQRAQGLQDRRLLAEDAGMLFIFDEMAPIHMWMKNTLVSLDMIFAAADGKIVNIAERTEPMSLDTVSSVGPARAVLEVRAGTARRLGIKPGDRIVHPRLGPSTQNPRPAR